jgi:hypothetical protein
MTVPAKQMQKNANAWMSMTAAELGADENVVLIYPLRRNYIWRLNLQSRLPRFLEQRAPILPYESKAIARFLEMAYNGETRNLAWLVMGALTLVPLAQTYSDRKGECCMPPDRHWSYQRLTRGLLLPTNSVGQALPGRAGQAERPHPGAQGLSIGVEPVQGPGGGDRLPGAAAREQVPAVVKDLLHGLWTAHNVDSCLIHSSCCGPRGAS